MEDQIPAANHTAPMPHVPTEMDLGPEFRTTFDGLRAALLELYSTIGADPDKPQVVARQLRINKTLTWNISKVIRATDSLEALPNVPGAAAIGSLLNAVRREGASSKTVARVQDAAKSFDEVVKAEFGDRGTLELIVDGLGRGRTDRLELSRKLAFRGNSGLWGVQAKTRLMSVCLAPNHESPDRMDIAIVRGFTGFRRLRSDVRWPIFQIRGWGEQGEPIESQGWHNLEDDTSPLPLMRRFSTVDPDKIEAVQTARGTDYVLAPGPIGNSGAVDCFVGDFERSAVSKYRTDVDTTGEFGATIAAPTERLVFDLIVHSSLEFALKPQVLAFGGVFAERFESSPSSSFLSIPMTQEVVPLPGRPPVVATQTVPQYPEIVQFVQQRLNRTADEFRGCRLEVSYPPLGSTVLLRFDLPPAP